MSQTTTSAKRRKKAPAPVTPERVTLARELEHQGKKLPPGTEITVHPETALWLRAVGVVPRLPTPRKD